ncbi:hypothetical protein [Halocatena marina]|uniref:hypothetical protein n=1 Tax=Halocatena marina TaxID=2934937 RepID=UPI00200C20C7|nr:hypothetical protein [Halocatena marina]
MSTNARTIAVGHDAVGSGKSASTNEIRPEAYEMASLVRHCFPNESLISPTVYADERAEADFDVIDVACCCDVELAALLMSFDCMIYQSLVRHGATRTSTDFDVSYHPWIAHSSRSFTVELANESTTTVSTTHP